MQREDLRNRFGEGDRGDTLTGRSHDLQIEAINVEQRASQLFKINYLFN